jgi:hypothetical protein
MARKSKSSKGQPSTRRRPPSSAATFDSEGYHKPEERCPICETWDCEKHLLALFDATGGTGEYGVGLTDGPLSEVKEIEELLERTCLAWVQSVRTTGKPKAPQWIEKEPDLKYFFDALGRGSYEDGAGFDPAKYESEQDAAWDLRANSEDIKMIAREMCLYELLRSCGWKEDTTETDLWRADSQWADKFILWWALKPREIVKTFRAKLQGILSEATRTATNGTSTNTST